MEPNQEQPQENQKKKFSFKNKKLKVIAAVLVAVVVLGGVASALVVKSIYNRPENVLATALGNYLLDGEDKKFDSTLNVELEGAEAGFNSVELKMGVETAGKTTQADIEANLSIFKLRGAVQMNENGNVYVQVKDLPALLGSNVAAAYGIPDALKEQIAQLDSKWIEITKEDLAGFTGQTEEESAFDKCTNAVYAAMDNEDLGDKVDKFYRKNKFLLAKTSSTEEVNGKKLLKVEVGGDRAKFNEFVKVMSQTDEIKDLASKCSSTSSSVSESANTGEVKNAKVVVWLDRSKKELVKMEASGDSYTDGKKSSTMKFSMDVAKPSGKLSAPAEVINIKELIQSLGIDPAMFLGGASAL